MRKVRAVSQISLAIVIAMMAAIVNPVSGGFRRQPSSIADESKCLILVKLFNSQQLS